jgi:hypothetical protein
VIKRIAVIPKLEFTGNREGTNSLKQLILYFDEIALAGLVHWREYPFSDDTKACLDFLDQRGLIRQAEYPPDYLEQIVLKFFGQIPCWYKLAKTIPADQVFSEIMAAIKNLYKFHIRETASELQQRLDATSKAIPVYWSAESFDREFCSSSSEANCISVILKQFPVPNDSVSLEELIDFKNDQEAQHKRDALNAWLNRKIRESLSPNELTEELAYLLNDYTEYIKLQRKKFDMGIVRTVLRAGSEVAEGLVRLKFTKVLDTLFSFERHNLALSEAELKAPGREVAYIALVKDKF